MCIRDSISLIDGVIDQIKRELKNDYGVSEKINVIATGGYSELIAHESKYIEYIEPDLMLDGLKIIYDRIKK